MEQKENKLGVMPIKKLTMVMGLPIMISMLIQALYNIVDTIFVAQISENATKAVSIAYPIQMLVIAVAVGTGVGLNSLLSRRLGEKNYQGANDAAKHGIVLGLLSWVIFLVFGLFFARTFFEKMTDNMEIVNAGADYLGICMVFSFGVFVQIMCERIMQGTGHSLGTMVIQGVGALVNIILDPIFIFGYFGAPKMGVAGAAVATVVGQIAGMILGLILVVLKVKEIDLSFRKFRMKAAIVKQIYIVGFPSIIMQSIMSFLMTVLNAVLMPVSELSVWVLGVYFKVQSFVFMPVFGLTNGLVPIIAFNYGAANKKRIYEAIRFGTIVSVAIMAAGTVIFLTIPELIVSMFNPTDATKAAAAYAFRIISSCFMLAGVSIVMSCVYTSVGNGLLSLIVSVVRQLAVLLPVSLILIYTVGVDAVWWAFPAAELVGIVISLVFMKYVDKKYIKPLPDIEREES